MIKPAQQSARPSEDERIRTSASRFWRPTDTTGAHPQARHPTRGDDVLPGNLGLTARCRTGFRHGRPARRPGLLRAREHVDVGTAQVGRVAAGERHGRRVTGRLEGRKRFHFVTSSTETAAFIAHRVYGSQVPRFVVMVAMLALATACGHRDASCTADTYGALGPSEPSVIGLSRSDASHQAAAAGLSIRVMCVDGLRQGGNADHQERRVNVGIDQGKVTTAHRY